MALRTSYLTGASSTVPRFPILPFRSVPRNVLDEGQTHPRGKVYGSFGIHQSERGKRRKGDRRASKRERDGKREKENERKRQKFIKTADATGTVLGWTNWFSRVFSLLCIIRAHRIKGSRDSAWPLTLYLAMSPWSNAISLALHERRRYFARVVCAGRARRHENSRMFHE